MKGMVDQKWKWIADSIDCTDDNSILTTKIKLHWFDLKKFIRKKNGDFCNEELSTTGGDSRKAVNSANS